MSPRLAVALVALTFVSGLAEGVSLLSLIPLLQLVGLDAQQGALGRIMQWFSGLFAVLGLAPTLPIVLAFYVALVAAQSVLQRQQSIVQTRLREQVVHSLRTRLYRAIVGTTWVYFSQKRVAAFSQMLTERVDRVANASYYLLDLFVTTVLVIVYIAVALRVQPAMTLVVVASGCVLALLLRPRIAAARRSGQSWSAASSRLYAAASDHLDSLKMAKSYGAIERHAARFARLSQDLMDASREAMDGHAASRQWVAIGSAALLAFIVYVSQAVMQMPAAALFLLIFLFARVMPRVAALYEKAQTLAVELPAFESVLEAERECLQAAEAEPRLDEPVHLEHRIDVQDVTFAYRSEGDAAPALRDVSLSIAARATTAIVGPSGAGKSTLADLLMGLVVPDSGEIRIDERPLTTDRLASWRSQIGYVSQETYLFHDTVRANLLWANPSADDDDIWRALTQAAAADFVRGLPQGVDTVVGDRGVLLSGGERQRLSLVRALLRHPRVLILDEATSSLDSENERRIQEAIDRLHEQITIVVITHRLSTIRNADVIHVIERGARVETGTWTTLTAMPGGRFRALCEAQGIEVATPIAFSRA
jgi:ATP-binding cassette subfamily C protein